jgi:UDP-N-acetylmuramoyl-L-alanyl-D-glutamate--2,6-diaminopimelate ligase
VLTYGLANADIAATGMASTARGIALSVATPWGRGDVETGLVGAFNASNVLGCLGALLVSDVPLADALSALAGVVPPPGRMQRLGSGAAPLVVIDYAHSPDALEKVLTALRPAVVEGGELVCVFGCGGDRDAGKRPEMGRVAGRLAERVIVTSDNPRGEDPASIGSAIVRGIRDTGNRRWTVDLDRATAINAAIAGAKPGDVVLVAGKGHEDYQETNGVREHFSDAEVATAALGRRSAA